MRPSKREEKAREEKKRSGKERESDRVYVLKIMIQVFLSNLEMLTLTNFQMISASSKFGRVAKFDITLINK